MQQAKFIEGKYASQHLNKRCFKGYLYFTSLRKSMGKTASLNKNTCYKLLHTEKLFTSATISMMK